ncbi:hypothetical protein BOX15_Mlig020833g1 [Macrostomum lignano]|nr:hypothetical protein BOX15_Mlig033481g1 [Macrostomum lignano]PAA86544.1 hypothetical protein BOX15_Mlig020833g1 [Macrostomum lignano]
MTMDKMRYEGEVDIFRAVEKVKRNRPQLVGSQQEYEQCYSLAELLVEYFFSGRVSIQDSQSLRFQDLDRVPPVTGRPAAIADFRFPTSQPDAGGMGRRTLDALLLPCARRRRRERQLRLAAAIV